MPSVLRKSICVQSYSYNKIYGFHMSITVNTAQINMVLVGRLGGQLQVTLRGIVCSAIGVG